MGSANQKKSKNGKVEKPKVSGSLKEVENRRRQVFKPVLDNPYTQSQTWPFVDPKDAETILSLLEHLFNEVASYNNLVQKPTKPEILNHITIGFNSTVGALEKQAQSIHLLQKNATHIDSSQGVASPYIKYVFVTKFDIEPKIIVQHFPSLCLAASETKRRVKLVQLPRGASKQLSQYLGKSNVTIVGMSDGIKEAQGLYNIIENQIPDVKVQWLEELLHNGDLSFQKPSIRLLSTSAPVYSKKNDQKKKNQENKKQANLKRKQDNPTKKENGTKQTK